VFRRVVVMSEGDCSATVGVRRKVPTSRAVGNLTPVANFYTAVYFRSKTFHSVRQNGIIGPQVLQRYAGRQLKIAYLDENMSRLLFKRYKDTISRKLPRLSIVNPTNCSAFLA